MKRFWCIFCFSLATILFCNLVCTIILAEVNYNNNLHTFEKTPIISIIENQFDYNQYKYGFGSIKYNGCGAVAIFNILTLDGKKPNLAKIIHSMDLYGTNYYGILGTNLLAIKHYLNQYGYKVKFSTDTSKFDEIARSSKYAIFNYLSGHGGHFQLMCHYNKFNQTYKLINPCSNTTMQSLLNKLKEYPIKIMISIQDNI